jgi:hypothetical protein
MSPIAAFALALAVTWLTGIAFGLRIGWMLWRRKKPSKNWTYVRPRNVILLHRELRERASGTGRPAA